MGWTDTWNDIHQGGAQRWKIQDADAHSTALSHMKSCMTTTTTTTMQPETATAESSSSRNILAPLCGDDPMIHQLWKQPEGHYITAMDLVPLALERMRNQFQGRWTRQEHDINNGMVVWKHESGRVTQYQGDALQVIPELMNTIDLVYDKDSFGALPKDLRQAYTRRISDYCKPGATVYMEVKLRDNHETSKDIGPPFSLGKEDLMDMNNYGDKFEYVKGLGSVYPVSMPGVLQTGHILQRK